MEEKNQTRGKNTRSRKRRKGAILEAIVSLCLAAIVFGTISPKIIMLIVIITVAIPIPVFPNKLMAKAVARLEAQLFTILFPIKIVVKSFDGLASNEVKVFAEGFLAFFKRRSCIFEREVHAVSEPEKNAEQQSKRNRLGSVI